MKARRASLAAWAGVLVFAFASPGQAAFLDPLATPAMKSSLAPKALINGLSFAGQRIVAVGQRGHILLSDDDGSTWKQATVPVSVDLTAVLFASPKRGWAVGHGGVVLTTEDGGASWSKQLDGHMVGQLLVAYYADGRPDGPDEPALAQLRADARRFAEEGPDKPFLDLWFENETTGYVVGLFNLILKTCDGGRTWQPLLDRTDNPKALHFNAIRAVGDELYLAGEQGLVLKLDPATQRFKALPMDYRGTFFGITGKPGAIIVYGLRGNAFRSGDGGASWQKIDTGVAASLTAASVTTDGRLLLVSQAGQVLVSTDDGQSFAKLKLERPIPAAALLEVPGRNRLIAGARGIHQQSLK